MSSLLTHEPIWVRSDVVHAIHRRQVAEHGGWAAMADEAMLHSILRRPQNLFHPHGFTLAELAACYAYGIAVHRPFCDGSIRTALIVTRLFLHRNGWSLKAAPIARYRLMKALAAGELSEAQVADWLTSTTYPRDALAPTGVNAYT